MFGLLLVPRGSTMSSAMLTDVSIVLPVHPYGNPSSEFQAACDSYACLIHVDLDRQS